jgi:hypothetical protein
MEDPKVIGASNPYVGPRPFKSSEKGLFAGRDREKSDLQNLILSYRAVLLYAQSGAGKTSLVNAGLLPLLEKELVTAQARVGGELPPDIDHSSLTNIYVFNTLASYMGSRAEPAALLKANLADYLKAPEDRDALVIFDQFEELFTAYPERWHERKEFFQQLKEVLRRDKGVRLFFVIREDHLAEVDPYAEFLPEGFRIRYRLERLRSDKPALDAIRRPAEESGKAFAPGAAEQLAQELSRTNAKTPDGKLARLPGEFVEPVYLQVVCGRLWRGIGAATMITAQDIGTYADVDAALAEFYEDAVRAAAKAGRESEKMLRSWFERALITPAHTRGIVYQGKQQTAGLSNETINLLENLRLLHPEPRAGATWYELTHDRLIEPIQRSNAKWRQGRRRIRARITTGAAAALIAVPGALLFRSPWAASSTEQALVVRAQLDTVHALLGSVSLSNVDSVADQLVTLSRNNPSVARDAYPALDQIRFSILDEKIAKRVVDLLHVQTPALPSLLAGHWRNTNPATIGITALEISSGRSGLEIHAFGNGRSTPSDLQPVVAQAATLPLTAPLTQQITLTISRGLADGQLFVATAMQSPLGQSRLREAFGRVAALDQAGGPLPENPTPALPPPAPPPTVHQDNKRPDGGGQSPRPAVAPPNIQTGGGNTEPGAGPALPEGPVPVLPPSPPTPTAHQDDKGPGEGGQSPRPAVVPPNIQTGGGNTEPSAGTLSPASRARATAAITVDLFDGARRPLPSTTNVLLTLQDGNRNTISQDFRHGSVFTLTGLPFYDNFGDNYTVIASAQGYRQAGFTPLRVAPGMPQRVDLMLIPADAQYNFKLADWQTIGTTRPAWQALFAAGAASSNAARDRYVALMQKTPAALADLLNVTASLASIHLPDGGPVQYLKRLVWEDGIRQDAVLAYADAGLLDQLQHAAAQGVFTPVPGVALFVPGATRGYKQVQFGEGNVQLIFFEQDRQKIDGSDCVKVQIEINYFKDLLAHSIVDVTPNSVSGTLTDPKTAYVLRWIAGRHAGVPEFNPLYTIE